MSLNRRESAPSGPQSDWHWETDRDHRFTRISGSGHQENPSPTQECIGQTPWETDCNLGNKTLWVRHRARLARHEAFFNLEYEREDRQGGRSVLRISGAPVFGAAGEFMGYRGVGADITAHRQADAALRTSEARLRAIVSALAEGVLLGDADGRILDCNASAERIYGRTLAQMKGQHFATPNWTMLNEDGSPMLETERPSFMARHSELPQLDKVVGYSRPDGSTLWTLVNVQPLFDAQSGAMSGFATSLTDITKRKNAEQEIVRLNMALESRVLRRTAQLALANKELEAFSYSVAHDLRSPLSTIDGFCTLLAKVVPPESGEKARRYLERIKAGVQRMGELTDGLLSLAKLSRSSLKWSTVNISEEAAKIIRQWTEREPWRPVLATIEPGMLARADSSLLREVLENLIANAWKFSSRNERTEITVGSEASSDGKVVYFVQDKGAGFDMAYSGKLFGTFERLHSPEEFPGSGIGLATVNRIITRHGGKIWAQSAPGEGSIFRFTLGTDENHAAVNADDALQSSLGMPPASVSPQGGDTGVAATLSEQQFSYAFEHAPIGMALIGLDSRRLRVNNAFCKMLGYSESEMLSRTVHDITHPDDVEWDVLQRARALAGEIESYQWEKRYIHKDGHILWGQITCSLVRDADRRPLHFITQMQDTTERKKAEQALRHSEERFRILTGLSSDWFWEQDKDFRFVQVSGKPANTVKFVQQDVTGLARWELEHLQMSESAWLVHKAQLERHEEFHDFELTLLDNHGELRYESISGVPVFDASGAFAGYRGTGRDTTELRRMTDALRTSELQLRDITDTVPALIAYLDAEQRFAFHNRAYEEVFGLSHDQIHGKTMLDVMGAELYERVAPQVTEVLAGYPVAYQRAHKTARGAQRLFLVKYFPRYGDGEQHSKVIGFYSIATDITQLGPDTSGAGSKPVHY
ncbi:MAG: domain S-box protein [Polaromonas sp.]|nr:domain S-box protein [Polaromonas sp.]